MRFIDGKKGNLQRVQELAEALGAQPLRCHVEQVDFTAAQGTANAVLFFR